jgi:hypothetical protein
MALSMALGFLISFKWLFILKGVMKLLEIAGV